MYFAYGSNLARVRLIKRVASARLVITGTLTNHQLLFHKIGRDGSAKCDAFYTGQKTDVIYGAVYRIHRDHKQYLDQAEGFGNGYEIKSIPVKTKQGTITAFTYYATHIDSALKPFHWYKKHVQQGVQEHNFPKRYRNKVLEVISIDDHDPERMEKELAIHQK